MAQITISLTLEKTMLEGVERRARVMGRRTSEYLRQLVEAAYAARVGFEKGVPASDDELDQAVRAIFCLSGEFDVKTIAKATGFSRNLVDNVLRGLTQVSGELRAAPRRMIQEKPEVKLPPALPAPVPETGAEPVKADARPPRNGWPPYVYNKIAKLWADGRTIAEIAAAVGKNVGQVSVWMGKNRDLCPKRTEPKGAA